MTRKLAMTRAAALVATVLLIACGTEVPVAPEPASASSMPGAALELTEADEGPIESIVLWPSDDVYTGSFTDDVGPSMTTLAAAAAQPDIRIGVVESTNNVYLGAAGSWTIRDRANGVLITSGTGGAAKVTLASVSESFMTLQVSCGSAAAISLKKAAAEADGHQAFTEQIAACTRLYIGRYPVGTGFGIRNAYRNVLLGQGHALGDSFWKTITIGGGTIYRVTHGATVVENINPVVVTSADGGQVTVGTSTTSFRRYRGAGFAHINSAGTLAGVNQLPMEQYLYGVVPRELGPIAFPEVEAQKAQSVAARTYAMVGLNKRNSDGYDLRATTSDQVYGGWQDEHPVSNAAVDATAGVVATYNGAMISTLYSSASGGHTSSNEEVYSSAPVPYLRGVPDAQRGQSLEHVPTLQVFRAHANPRSLRNAGEGDFESDWSSRHRWTFEWTAAEISSIISAWKGFPVGTVSAINVLERGPSGRALIIEYVTDAGSFTHTKDLIRASLRYVGPGGAYTNLPSTLIFVEPVTANGAATGGFRVYGGGFGHGVGMSQTGAVGMAEKGRTYDEILKHYYTGIALEAAY